MGFHDQLASHLLGRPVAARNAENPRHPLLDDDFDEWNSGGKSASGVRVNRNRVLGYPAAWRAVNLISGDVGKLSLYVWKLDGDNRKPDQSRPAYKLLYRKPNPLMTAFIFKQTLQAHVLLEGNGYAFIDRDGAGRPTQLLILDPGSVEPIVKGGMSWYIYQPATGAPRKIPGTDVLHIKGLGFDGTRGYAVLKVARDSFGGALAARDHAARYYANGARPGGVIEHPGKLTDTARRNLRESWERIHKGLENQHKVAILEEGVKYTGFNSNAKDAQLIESREFDAREIANIFGVPTHKVGDSSKVAYNSLGEENQSYYDDTLSRWLQLWAEECTDKLLTEEEKDKGTHECGWDYQEIERANLQAQTAFVNAGIVGGWLSPDEARAVFGYNPRSDGRGGEYKQQPTAPVPAAGGQPDPNSTKG